jgi:hypothetical protein
MPGFSSNENRDRAGPALYRPKGGVPVPHHCGEDKTKTKKKHRTESITSVADGIAAAIAPALNIRQFPESFCNGTEKTLAMHVDRSLLRRIRIEPLMNMADVTISGEGGRELFKGHYPLPVTEAVVRSVLLGRESFLLPTERADAEKAVSGFLNWLDGMRLRLNDAITESALGSGPSSGRIPPIEY